MKDTLILSTFSTRRTAQQNDHVEPSSTVDTILQFYHAMAKSVINMMHDILNIIWSYCVIYYMWKLHATRAHDTTCTDWSEHSCPRFSSCVESTELRMLTSHSKYHLQGTPLIFIIQSTRWGIHINKIYTALQWSLVTFLISVNGWAPDCDHATKKWGAFISSLLPGTLGGA